MIWSIFFSLLTIGLQTSVWKKFQAQEGTFSVLMPGQVQEKKITAATDIGTLDYHTVYAEFRDTSEANFLFAVSYCDYPVLLADSIELSEELFSTSLDEQLQQVKGRLIYVSADHTYGVQGKVWRIHYNQDKNVLRSRAFVYKNRLYSLQTFGVNSPVNDHSDRFFNSFILNKD